MADESPHTLPRLLLVHDGELADVGTLLESLGVAPLEERSELSAEDRDCAWDLVVTTTRRGVDLHLSKPPAALVAIVDQDSRTLRSSLGRVGVHTLVRRPVHPAALRALFLHSLYRGPEKRSAPRVSVGGAVRIRSGWRWRPAVLADLSVGGCRLLVKQPLERGQAFSVLLPAELSGLGGTLKLEARTLELGPLEGASCERSLTAGFEAVGPRQRARLEQVLAHFATGPARYDGAQALRSAPPGPARAEADTRARSLEAEAGRVLMGRDLSFGGMRVDPNPNLAQGMQLELAAHLPQRRGAVRLRARVERDEGPRGLLLRFENLGEEMRRALEALMDALLIVGVESGTEDDFDPLDQPVLIAEILQTA